MSSGAARLAVDVLPVARRVLASLDSLRAGGGSRRAEIAGSLRRHLIGERVRPGARVSDIEIVCEPVVGLDLLGEPTGSCGLAHHLVALRSGGVLRWRDETHPAPAGGWLAARRMWALVVLPEGIPLDVFAVRPPAQWGAILAIRTGPAEYSQRLVTRCQERGFRCTGGRLVDAKGRTVQTPEERNFIETCGLPWAAPGERR